jgi:tetratricopeptide (TPR) repeat protein
MGGGGAFFGKFIFLMGGCLLPSLFSSHAGFADTIVLKNGKELKGLVVERHADRVIVSTENGELPILLRGIKDIQYDEPDQNFIETGKRYEAEGKFEEALVFYEKALAENPKSEDARVAASGVKSKFFSTVTEGPRNEVEKQQLIYESWGKSRPVDTLIKERTVENAKLLKNNMGLTLKRKGDWVVVENADSRKAAAQAGLKRNDRLVAVDNTSLRYLSPEIVMRYFLVPQYSSFMLRYERDIVVRPEEGAALKDLGLKLSLQYDGVVIESIKDKSAAAAAGVREQDWLVSVQGQSTRYLALPKTAALIEEAAKGGAVMLTVRRSCFLARK